MFIIEIRNNLCIYQIGQNLADFCTSYDIFMLHGSVATKLLLVIVLFIFIQDQSQQTEDGEQGAEVPLIKQFSGVGIKVSFTGNQFVISMLRIS